MKTVLLFFSRDVWFRPPKNGMSRWGLAKIINRYIIQVPIIIFWLYSPTLVSYHLNIFHSSKFPIVCCKSQNFTYLPSIFLVPTFLSYPSRNFVWHHLLPKREHSNAGFAGIPARYPILRMSVSAHLRGRKISQIIPNLWMTRAYLYQRCHREHSKFPENLLRVSEATEPEGGKRPRGGGCGRGVWEGPPLSEVPLIPSLVHENGRKRRQRRDLHYTISEHLYLKLQDTTGERNYFRAADPPPPPPPSKQVLFFPH